MSKVPLCPPVGNRQRDLFDYADDVRWRSQTTPAGEWLRKRSGLSRPRCRLIAEIAGLGVRHD